MRIWLWLLLAPVLSAQRGSVEGVVANSVTRAGIAGVHVDLQCEGHEDRETATDSSGRFQFADLAPGPCIAKFSHDLFADPQSDEWASANFVATAGGDPARLRIELMPRSTLRGKLTDSEGRPAAGVDVELVRLRYRGQYSATTDASGEFVFDNVRPTAYLISVARGNVTTFYPGFTDQRQAAPVVIAAGAELTGYDFRLQQPPLFHIRGAVLDETGKPLPGAHLRLRESSAAATSAPDGSFEFAAVPAGEWHIAANFVEQPKQDPARTAMTAQEASASVRRALLSFLASERKGAAAVTVSNRDPERLSLRMSVPFTLPVACEPVKCTVKLQAVDGDNWSAAGDSLVPLAFPGRYQITATTKEPGYYAAVITLAGRDVTGKEIQVGASTPIHVLLKNDTGNLRGTVERSVHATVVLSAQGEVLKTRCDSEGRFDLSALPPGDYSVWAFERLDVEGLRDRDFVRSLQPSATALRIRPGETATVQLRVTPWPE